MDQEKNSHLCSVSCVGLEKSVVIFSPPSLSGSLHPGPPSTSPPDGLLSPPSPSQCGLGVQGEGEEVWRGSSIASLRRRAFEHSAVSMTVFR